LSLVDAVIAAGEIVGATAHREIKKRYSERLSAALAIEVGEGLRAVGFPNVKPVRGGRGEKEFQGGLGPKRVDVSYADERHGLLLAVSIKTICFQPYGKNLKNRFGDLCTEAINLHMRFPYSVMCALFAMPEDADLDRTGQRHISTFKRATMLFGTISGRTDYSVAGERFENVTMMLFRPLRAGGKPWVRLIDAGTGQDMSEMEYFLRLRQLYNVRNPHTQIGVEALQAEGEDST
jgi:hypothetical protein